MNFSIQEACCWQFVIIPSSLSNFHTFSRIANGSMYIHNKQQNLFGFSIKPVNSSLLNALQFPQTGNYIDFSSLNPPFRPWNPHILQFSGHQGDLILRVLDCIVTISFGYILYCGCFNIFCDVWFCVCVHVLVICVLLFTVFCIVCTVFFTLSLLCLYWCKDYCHRVTTQLQFVKTTTTKTTTIIIINM